MTFSPGNERFTNENKKFFEIPILCERQNFVENRETLLISS